MLQKFLAVLEKNSTHFSSLNKLRLKTITIFNTIFITVMLFVIIMRLLNGQITVAIANSIAVSLIATSLFLAFRGSLNASILTSCLVLTVLTFALAYSKLLEAVHIIPQFTLLLATFIIILKTKISRYIYIVCCLILLLLIFENLNYSFSTSLPFIIQIFGFSIAFNYFVNHLEKQDASLNFAILKLANLNKKQITLNKSLINKNEELKTFGHIMSHDLKSPLNNIISFSSLISKNESFEDEQHKRKLFYIKQSANKMKILIEELLVYHKVEQEDIEFEEVSINEILNATLSNFYLDEKESNLKFVIEELPHIKSNRFLLQILFNNLVSNAIKYQPTCRKNHIPKIEINAKEKLNTIEIYVGDNGIGIESKHLNNLYKPFKRFHTNKAYKGTGLGLSICKRIMDKHNGLIKLHQTSENGTTFKLVFQKVPFVSNFKNTALIDDLATVC